MEGGHLKGGHLIEVLLYIYLKFIGQKRLLSIQEFFSDCYYLAKRKSVVLAKWPIGPELIPVSVA